MGSCKTLSLDYGRMTSEARGNMIGGNKTPGSACVLRGGWLEDFWQMRCTTPNTPPILHSKWRSWSSVVPSGRPYRRPSQRTPHLSEPLRTLFVLLLRTSTPSTGLAGHTSPVSHHPSHLKPSMAHLALSMSNADSPRKTQSHPAWERVVLPQAPQCPTASEEKTLNLENGQNHASRVFAYHCTCPYALSKLLRFWAFALAIWTQIKRQCWPQQGVCNQVGHMAIN